MEGLFSGCFSKSGVERGFGCVWFCIFAYGIVWKG